MESCAIALKIILDDPVLVVAENPRVLFAGLDPLGDLLADIPLGAGAEDIGTRFAGFQLAGLLDQGDMDGVGNPGLALDAVRKAGVDVAESNALETGGARPNGIESQLAHLADAVAHPLFLTAVLAECDGASDMLVIG